MAIVCPVCPDSAEASDILNYGSVGTIKCVLCVLIPQRQVISLITVQSNNKDRTEPQGLLFFVYVLRRCAPIGRVIGQTTSTPVNKRTDSWIMQFVFLPEIMFAGRRGTSNVAIWY
jgi:hypothetical protein